MWSLINLSEVCQAGRIDAEHFRPDYLAVEEKVAGFSPVPLGRIASYINRGVQPEYQEGGTIPVLRTVNVREHGFSETRQEFVSDAFYRENPRGQVRKGDILMTSTGVGTLGRVAYHFEDTSYFADGHITIIRGVRNIKPLFLVTLLQSRIGFALIERRQRGSSGQIEIYPSDIASIPIPQLDDKFQQEIVSLQERAHQLRQKSKSLYAQAEALLLSELGLDDLDLSHQPTYTRNFSQVWSAGRLDAEHFQPKYYRLEEVIQSGRFSTCVLGELIEPIRNGFDYRNFAEEGTPYIRVGDIRIGRIDIEGTLRVPITINDVDKGIALQPGDILFTRKGTFGNAAVVRQGQEHVIISSEIMLLRLKDRRVRPDYLALFLNSQAGYLQVERRVHGVAFYSISQADLASILVPIACEDIQEQLSSLVKRSIETEQEAKRLLEEAKRRVEAMIMGENA
jgi:restriction endonuclease S subunit